VRRQNGAGKHLRRFAGVPVAVAMPRPPATGAAILVAPMPVAAGSTTPIAPTPLVATDACAAGGGGAGKRGRSLTTRAHRFCRVSAQACARPDSGQVWASPIPVVAGLVPATSIALLCAFKFEVAGTSPATTS